MAENSREAELKISVDSTQARDGVREIKTEVRSLGPAAAAAGKEASAGIDQIGKSSQAAASQVDKSTRSLISQIQRVTAEMQAGGRASSQYFEAIAAQRGISADAIAPYLRQLEQASKAQVQVGVSAAQMQAALRGVPAQFTDIATSIASGQAPLTVLLQQGGQLKDMFGGIGPAARALGGYIAGLVNPFTLAAAAAAALVVAYKQGSAEADAYNRALILTGNAAGTTASKLGDMAKRIGDSSGTQREAAAALAELAGSTRIGAQNLERFAAVAASLERTVGQPLAETRKQFEELAKAPADASIKLNEQYNYLTASVYRQIKALEDQGRATDAANLAQRTYADAMAERTKRLEENLGLIERAWKGVTGAAKGAWDAMLNVGRPDTLQQQLDALNKQIADSQAMNGRMPGGLLGMAANSALDSRIAALTATRDALQETIRLETRLADTQAARAAQEAAGTELAKRAATSRKKSLEDELAVVRQLAKEAGNTPAALADLKVAEAAIRAKYESAKATNAALKAEQELADAQAEALGVSKDYNKTLEQYQKLRASGALSEEAYVQAIEALIAKQPAVARQLKEQAAEAKAAEEARKALLKAENESLEARLKDAQSSADLASKLQFEAEKVGLTAEQVARLTLERELSADATKLERLEGELATTTRQSEAIAIQRQIDELNALSQARQNAFNAASQQRATDENKRMLDAQQRDYERFSDQVGQALANSLMDGGKSGLDYVKGIFRTAILQPALKPLAQAVSGIDGSLLGVGGQSTNGIVGLGQVGNTVNGLGSLMSMMGFSTNALAGGISGSIGAFGAGMGLTAAEATAAAAAYQSAGYTAIAGSIEAGAAAGAAAGSAAGSIGSTLSALSSAAPYIAAVAVVAMALMSKGGGPKSGGSSVSTINGDNMTAAERELRLYTPNESNAMLQTTTQNLATSVQALATRFGGDSSAVRYGLGFDTDPLGDAPNRISAFAGDYSVTNRDLGRDAGSLEKGISDELIRLTLDGLQASNLADGFAEIFDRLDPATASPQAIANLISLADQIAKLGDNMQGLPGSLGRVAEMSAVVREQLVNSAGGFDALSANLGRYFEAFFTDQERVTAAQTQLRSAFDALGQSSFSLSGSTQEIRAGFRQLVEGLSVTDEATAKQYASLVALAGPLDDFLTATDALAGSVEDAAVALAGMTQSASEAVMMASGWATADDWIRYARAIGDNDVLVRSLQISFTEAWSRLDLGAAFPVPTSIAEFTAAIEGIDAAAQTSYPMAEKLRGALNLADDFSDLIGALGGTSDAVDDAVNSIQASIGSLGTIRPLLTNGQFAERLTPLLQAQWTDILSGVTDAAIPTEVPTSAAALLAVYDQLSDTQPELAARIATEFLPAWTDLQQAISSGAGAVTDAITGIQAAINGLSGIRFLLDDGAFAQRLQPLLQAQWTQLIGSLGDQASLFDLPATMPTTREGLLAAYDDLNAIVPSVAESLARDFLPAWSQLYSALNNNPARDVANDFDRLAERMRAALSDLGEYARSLFASDLSPLSPAEQLASAQTVFRDTLAAARDGDIDAIGALRGASDAYLRESRDFYGSNDRAADVFREVTSALLTLSGAMSPTEDMTPAEQSAWQQRGTLIELVQSVDGRLSRIEGDSALATAR